MAVPFESNSEMSVSAEAEETLKLYQAELLWASFDAWTSGILMLFIEAGDGGELGEFSCLSNSSKALDFMGLLQPKKMRERFIMECLAPKLGRLH